MHCESCVQDVSESLYKLDGIAKVEANLKDQLVRIEGTGMHTRLPGHIIRLAQSLHSSLAHERFMCVGMSPQPRK